MKYYKVIAKCGHVGKNKYIEITFPVVAENAKKAAKKIMNHSKVKKQLKNAISSVEEISYDLYLNLKSYYLNDDYVGSHYSKEYDICNYDVKLIEKTEWKKSFKTRKERVSFLLKKSKILLEDKNYEYVY